MITEAYQKAITDLHTRKSKWGNSVLKYSAGDLLGLLATRPYVRTMLDYGCGKGELKPFVQKWFPEVTVTEYDPGIPGKNSLPNEQFDLVFSCDVLEHVEPASICETISKLAELTKYVMYHNIACYETGQTFKDGPYVGQDLHLTLNTPSEWGQRFKRVLGPDEKMSFYEGRSIIRRSGLGLRARSTIIYERLG